MVSENTDSRRASELRAEAAEALDRRDDGHRLSALYGLTPKAQSATVTAIREGVEERCRALVAPLHPAAPAHPPVGHQMPLNGNSRRIGLYGLER